jgi:choline dehydrogenase-like flavoprotein
MTVITTVALPTTLPAPAPTKDAAFPEPLRERHGNGGNDLGVVRQDQMLYSAPYTDHMLKTAPGADFLATVAAAAAMSKEGTTPTGDYVGHGVAFGVFAPTGAAQSKDGAYYVAPMWWKSEANDEGDIFLSFHPGERVAPLSTQLQAVVTEDAWADLRPAH